MRGRAITWLLLVAMVATLGWMTQSVHRSPRPAQSATTVPADTAAPGATAAMTDALSTTPDSPGVAPLPTSQLNDPGPSPCWSLQTFLPRLSSGEDPATVVQAIAAFHQSPDTALPAWQWLTADDHRSWYDFDAAADTDAEKIAAVVAWHNTLVATQLTEPAAVHNTQCLVDTGVTFWRSEVLQPGEWVLVTRTGKVARRASCGNFLWAVATTTPHVPATDSPPATTMATEPSDSPAKTSEPTHTAPSTSTAVPSNTPNPTDTPTSIHTPVPSATITPVPTETEFPTEEPR